MEFPYSFLCFPQHLELSIKAVPVRRILLVRILLFGTRQPMKILILRMLTYWLWVITIVIWVLLINGFGI